MSSPAAFCLLLSFASLICATELQKCPKPKRYGAPLGPNCVNASDPNRMPKTPLQRWFTREMFYDFFPFANLGWGPHKCLPYSYEAFILASRYFPEFGAGGATQGFTKREIQRRDVAAFFAHVVQETGENNLDLYNTTLSTEEASGCFYRGGFFNWFEGGPNSDFIATQNRTFTVQDAKLCSAKGRYCSSNKENDFWFPCADSEDIEARNLTFKGCYFGRGPLQLSWNYNYGQFEHFLRTKKIDVNLLEEPNLILTKMDPPLAMLASLWFYMTPQPPKPSMHDVVMGNWRPSTKNRRAGYEGSVFGPTSLIINKECGGEDAEEPGGPGESRRIKAFKWFCKHLNVTAGPERTMSCKGMLEGFDANPHKYSWQPAWSTMWKTQPCDCEPANYNGALPFYDPKFYPDVFVKENDKNRLRCVYNQMHYICTLCRLGKSFEQREMLEIHIAQDHLKHFPYSCDKCSFARFPTQYSVRFHCGEVHGAEDIHDENLTGFHIIPSPLMRSKERELKELLENCLTHDPPTAEDLLREKAKERLEVKHEPDREASPEIIFEDEIEDGIPEKPSPEKKTTARSNEYRETVPCLECGELITAQRTSWNYHVNTRHLRRPIFRCLGCLKTWMTIAISDVQKHVQTCHKGNMALLEDNRKQFNEEIRLTVREYFPYKSPHPVSRRKRIFPHEIMERADNKSKKAKNYITIIEPPAFPEDAVLDSYPY